MSVWTSQRRLWLPRDRRGVLGMVSSLGQKECKCTPCKKCLCPCSVWDPSECPPCVITARLDGVTGDKDCGACYCEEDYNREVKFSGGGCSYSADPCQGGAYAHGDFGIFGMVFYKQGDEYFVGMGQWVASLGNQPPTIASITGLTIPWVGEDDSASKGCRFSASAWTITGATADPDASAPPAVNTCVPRPPAEENCGFFKYKCPPKDNRASEQPTPREIMVRLPSGWSSFATKVHNRRRDRPPPYFADTPVIFNQPSPCEVPDAFCADIDGAEVSCVLPGSPDAPNPAQCTWVYQFPDITDAYAINNFCWKVPPPFGCPWDECEIISRFTLRRQVIVQLAGARDGNPDRYGIIVRLRASAGNPNFPGGMTAIHLVTWWADFDYDVCRKIDPTSLNGKAVTYFATGSLRGIPGFNFSTIERFFPLEDLIPFAWSWDCYFGQDDFVAWVTINKPGFASPAGWNQGVSGTIMDGLPDMTILGNGPPYRGAPVQITGVVM